ncbi:hypothetical protein F1559_003478 [Cyanidiococcus yangmingshanensis]|uniref:RRM domain-containing protein n=1 Tax=Cyanidiococcus yangmingshanensis TaxID=2690220 RepID=A0A7J7IKJ2_9RHOD|nr:hypothetical protein F1559_003478 [Cyanidiococcus yangmingshanensis]
MSSSVRPVLLLEIAKYALRADVEYLLKRYGDVWQKTAVTQIVRGGIRRNTERSRWLVQFREPSEATRVAQRLLEIQQGTRSRQNDDTSSDADTTARQPERNRRSRVVATLVSLAPLSFLERELNRPSLSRATDVGRALICSNLPRTVQTSDIWRLFLNGYDVEEVRITASAVEAEAKPEPNPKLDLEATDDAPGDVASDQATSRDTVGRASTNKPRPLACVVFRHEEDAWRALIERQGAHVRRRPVELTIVQ